MHRLVCLAELTGDPSPRLPGDIASALTRQYRDLDAAAIAISRSCRETMLSSPPALRQKELVLIEFDVAEAVAGAPIADCPGLRVLSWGEVERHETAPPRLGRGPSSVAVPELKMMLLLKKREDISRDQFIDYYETRHAELALDLLPAYARYSRSYFEDTRALAGGGSVDVLSEIWFWDDSHFEAFKAVLSDAGVREQIRADEENLFDASFKWVSMVSELLPPVGGDQPGCEYEANTRSETPCLDRS